MENLGFARGPLQLPLPLRVEAGITGIKGYSIVVASNSERGRSMQDIVQSVGEVSSYEKPAHEILAPFFDFVWGKCDVRRPPERQAELAKQFEKEG